MGMVYPNSIIRTNRVPFIVLPKKSNLDTRTCESLSLKLLSLFLYL